MKTKTYCEGFNRGRADAKLLTMLNTINDKQPNYTDINEKYKKAIEPFQTDEFLTGYGDGFDYTLLKAK